MGYHSLFSIPYGTLALGGHKYDYNIDQQFFDSFDNSVIHDGSITLRLDLQKEENMLLLRFAFDGMIRLECDRCLGIYSMPIQFEKKLVVKIVDEPGDDEDDDEVISIQNSSHSLNLAQHIYDYLSLQVPYRRIHPDKESGESTCDPEFLKQLEKFSHPDESHEDPRWDSLKKFKNQ